MKNTRKDNPSSTFYWKDYENDEGLRISSLAAQGLWMRLLCIAAKADPYGYILVNGCDPGVTGTARLGSVTEAEAATLLDELERNRVFSRDRKGRPFSRRMVKEAAISAKNQKNGKKGGNPALTASAGKQKEKRHPDNRPDNAPVKAPYPLPTSHTQREEDGGGGSACGISENLQGQTDRDRILAAIGVGPDGIAGPSKFIGGQVDMAEADRWLGLPGVTLDAACAEIARIMAAKPGGPPSSFKYFTPAMQRLSAALSAPPIEAGPAQARASPTKRLWNIDPNDFNPDGSLRQ